LHPPTARYGALALLSDANWAATQQAIAGGERRLGYFVGGGAMLWIAWVIGTGVGAFAGDAVGDPARFGLDAIMPAFFVCSLIAMARDRAAVPAWLVAAGATAGLSPFMPSQWAILVGSVVGAVTGLLRE
jgi:predicted branched-subunit amino acid permease